MSLGFNRTTVAVVLAAMMLMASSDRAARAQAPERSGAELVREGNRLLAADRFEEALQVYEAAEEKLPTRPEVAYNRGLAHYRLKDFAAAESAFQDAMARATPELEAAAKYNLGRCAHAAALANRADMQVAINDLTKAINYYDDALQVLPEEPDTVKNRALADRLRTYLEKRLEAQKQQQQQPTSQPTSQPDQPQTSQPTSQPSPSSQPTSQPQQGQQQEQEGDQQQEQEAQQGKEGEQNEQQGKQGQDQQQEGQPDEQKPEDGAQPKEGERKELTPEEAEGMLQEARDAERKRREEKRERRMRVRGRAKVAKDW